MFSNNSVSELASWNVDIKGGGGAGAFFLLELSIFEISLLKSLLTDSFTD